MATPSEESRAFPRPPGLNTTPSRASMPLYRYAESSPHVFRASLCSASGESIFTIFSDSKYPLSFQTERGLVAYAYNPEVHEKFLFDDEDMMYDPTQQYHHRIQKTQGRGLFNSRGLVNIAALVSMLIAILMLFVGYPAIAFYRDHSRNQLILANSLINSTGQFPLTTPGTTPSTGTYSTFVDQSTPSSAYALTGMNDVDYVLAFSDEFNYTGGRYQPYDNRFWVGQSSSQSSSDQITTADSQLVFNLAMMPSGEFMSGILDSTIPFCLGRGFIVVGMRTSNGTQVQYFWTGSWLFTDAAPADFVPRGFSLNAELSLSLTVGVFASEIPTGTPLHSIAPSYSIDYVRYYERQINPLLSGSEGCDLKRAKKIHVTLDLLKLPH